MSTSALDSRLLRFRHNPSAEDPGPLAAALLEECRTYHALEVLAAGLEESDENIDLLILGARAWLMEGDLLRAQKALLQAARTAPEDPRPFRWLAEVLIERRELERAHNVLDHAFELNPDDADLVELRKRAGERAEVNDTQPSPDTVSEPEAVSEPETVVNDTQPSPGGVPDGTSPVTPPPFAGTAFAVVETELPPPSFDFEWEEENEPESGPREVEFSNLLVAERKDLRWVRPTAFWAACALACGGFGYAAWSWWQTEASQLEATADFLELSPEVVVPEPVAVAGVVADAVAEAVLQTEPVAAANNTQPSPGVVPDAVTQLEFVGPPMLELRSEPAPRPVEKARALRKVEWLTAKAYRLIRARRYSGAIIIATNALETASEAGVSPGAQATALYLIGRAHLEQKRKRTASMYLSRAAELGEIPNEAWFYLGESLAAVNSPAARAAYERYLGLEPNSRLASRARKAIGSPKTSSSQNGS